MRDKLLFEIEEDGMIIRDVILVHPYGYLEYFNSFWYKERGTTYLYGNISTTMVN